MNSGFNPIQPFRKSRAPETSGNDGLRGHLSTARTQGRQAGVAIFASLHPGSWERSLSGERRTLAMRRSPFVSLKL